ncbi:hypothetical protein HA49_14820 [Tatumella morbirosei]|uniref:XshC-Cox1 family protein n=1 Tax=Tatumella morbirosei TaxID=642227 RepID=A0A095VBJ4_9GAMM|nr:XdhC family protein [Tatumella morbirosei]KGD72060.1 hypothetical protein HA49_14820 [Tatumella morbirosei]
MPTISSFLSLDQRVMQQAVYWLQQQQAIWLCTVLHSWGSAPRPPGAMLVVNAGGDFCGSISGGCIEDDFLSRLEGPDFRVCSQIVRYGGQGLAAPVELPCGGSLDVLTEHILPDEINHRQLTRLSQALNGGTPVIKTVSIGQGYTITEATAATGPRQLSYNSRQVILPVGAATEIFIAGYSPVAYECIRLALLTGYSVRICEHREDLFGQLLTDFPANPQLQIINMHPARWLELYGAGPGTAVLSLTHHPTIDDLSVSEAVNTNAFYIGAMGSASNSEKRRQRLREIMECSGTDIARLHAPIGLKIGSKTPAEIAISIMAQIISIRNATVIRRGAHPE